MQYSQLVATGSYLPEKSLTNQQLIQEKGVDTSDEWIVARTGIHKRHIITSQESTSTMAVAAAQRALASSLVSPQEIGLIVVATSTPNKFFPSTACFVQEALGIDGCPAFDVVAACAGFNYALSVADQFIRNHQAKVALVVGSESMSTLIDWGDRSTCVLFGDGAGAVVLRAAEKPGIMSTHLHAAGSYQDLLYSAKNLDGVPTTLVMNGREVFKLAVEKLGNMIDETLATHGLAQNEIDWLIPHQANFRIITALAGRLKLPMEKVVVTVSEHGNTSAASVPLALDVAVRDGRIKRGQLLLMESFGAGLAWGSALIRY